jgi:hypothetical protein
MWKWYSKRANRLRLPRVDRRYRQLLRLVVGGTRRADVKAVHGIVGGHVDHLLERLLRGVQLVRQVGELAGLHFCLPAGGECIGLGGMLSRTGGELGRT